MKTKNNISFNPRGKNIYANWFLIIKYSVTKKDQALLQRRSNVFGYPMPKVT